MYCADCGSELVENSKFCQCCGAKISTVNTISIQNEKVIGIEAAQELYEKGWEYTKIDNKKALQYFSKAAEIGHVEAQNKLGWCYEIGQYGLEKDVLKAMKWYAKAAKQGDLQSLANLGLIYLWDDDVETDYEKAVFCLTRAAEQGNVMAQYGLGSMYAKGEGVPQDYNQAMNWWEKAAKQGDADAQCTLGRMYLLGDKGVARDDSQAKKWLEKAAKQGNAEGEFRLGLLYLEGGKGVPRDYNQARKWIEKAAQQGNERAKEALEVLCNKPSSNSGCFITTAVCQSLNKGDDCKELKVFRTFRDEWLSSQEDGERLIKEYYQIAPNIVKSIDLQENKDEIYRNIWDKYLIHCFHSFLQSDYQLCKDIYVKMVHELSVDYLDDCRIINKSC